MAKELQKPFTSPSTPFWKKKPTLKQVIIMAIISFCISILFEMGKGTKIAFDELWEEGGYAYDVKAQYFVARFAGGGLIYSQEGRGVQMEY